MGSRRDRGTSVLQRVSYGFGIKGDLGTTGGWPGTKEQSPLVVLRCLPRAVTYTFNDYHCPARYPKPHIPSYNHPKTSKEPCSKP